MAANDIRYLYSGFSVEIPIKVLATGILKIQVVIESDNQYLTDGSVLRLINSVQLNNTKLNVAFIGGMSPAKGSQIACQLIRHSSENIGWYVFGGIGDQELANLQRKNLTKTGWYRRSQLADLIKLYQIDLVCILSPWPETFCYTLSEAWMCGVPVVAMDIGAVGDRTKRTHGGWLVNADASPSEILTLIEGLSRDSKEYREVKKCVENIKIRDIGEMVGSYHLWYTKAMEGTAPEYQNLSVEDKEHLLQAYLLETCSQHGSENISATGELTARVHSLEEQLYAIHTSLTYKITVFLSQCKFPFKRQIKGLMLKIYKKIKKN